MTRRSGPGVVVLRSDDDGRRWTRERVGIDRSLFAVSGSDGEVVAVGWGGTVVRLR